MDADPETEPNLDNYPYRVRTAYTVIVAEIGDLISIKDRHLIAETLYAMYTGLADDLY